MGNVWSSVLEFVLDKDNHRFLLLAALVIAVFFGAKQCESKKEYKQEVQKQKDNIEALGDSVEYYENKAGELTADKLALQTDVKQLKTLNKELSEEVEKEKDKVNYVAKINAEAEEDTTKADTTETIQYGDEQWKFYWNLSRSGDGWKRILEGNTTFFINNKGIPYAPITTITRNYLNLDIVTGIKTNDKGQKEIFIRSAYPNLRFNEINGAIIENNNTDARRRRFGIGFSLGAGYTPKGFQPFVGLTINYNLIQF